MTARALAVTLIRMLAIVLLMVWISSGFSIISMSLVSGQFALDEFIGPVVVVLAQFGLGALLWSRAGRIADRIVADADYAYEDEDDDEILEEGSEEGLEEEPEEGLEEEPEGVPENLAPVADYSDRGFTPADLQAVGLSIVGIYMLATAAVDLLIWIYYVMQGVSENELGGIVELLLGGPGRPQLLFAIIRLVIGSFLFFGAHAIKRYWERLRAPRITGTESDL